MPAVCVCVWFRRWIETSGDETKYTRKKNKGEHLKFNFRIDLWEMLKCARRCPSPSYVDFYHRFRRTPHENHCNLNQFQCVIFYIFVILAGSLFNFRFSVRVLLLFCSFFNLFCGSRAPCHHRHCCCCQDMRVERATAAAFTFTFRRLVRSWWSKFAAHMFHRLSEFHFNDGKQHTGGFARSHTHTFARRKCLP